MDDAHVVRDLLGQLGYTLTVDAVRERLILLTASHNDPVLLAVQDDAVVGLIALHLATMLQSEAPAARVTALVVRDEGRGAGVGWLLIDAGDDLARQAGCKTLELTTAVSRTDAHAFYRKLGFSTSSLRFSRPVACDPAS